MSLGHCVTKSVFKQFNYKYISYTLQSTQVCVEAKTFPCLVSLCTCYKQTQGPYLPLLYQAQVLLKYPVL